MCPSAHQVRGGDHRHDPGPAPRRGHRRERGGGLVTSGGAAASPTPSCPTESTQRAERGVTRPNIVKPETPTLRSTKAAHLFGVEVRTAPGRPGQPRADVTWVDEHVDETPCASSAQPATMATAPSTRSKSWPRWHWPTGRACTSTAASAAGCSPFARSSATTFPLFDFRFGGDEHLGRHAQYGYALKGTSVIVFRDKAVRNAQYFFNTDWTGGKYCSPGMDGSRSGGLIAATWAAMVSLGRDGYRRYAEAIFAHRGGHAGSGALPRRAARPRVAHLPVQLHLRRVRHLTT